MAEDETIRVFLKDSVPTSHLDLIREVSVPTSDNDLLNKVVRELEQRSAPTGHLPRAPREDGAGASVPTGHLPREGSPPPPKEKK